MLILLNADSKISKCYLILITESQILTVMATLYQVEVMLFMLVRLLSNADSKIIKCYLTLMQNHKMLSNADSKITECYLLLKAKEYNVIYC